MADDSRPAHHLPYELLLEIWQHNHKQGLQKGQVWIPSTLVLSQVCRWWRRASLTTPDLWRTIRFLVNARTPGVVDLVQLFLDRSDGRSLDIDGRLWCSGPSLPSVLRNEKEITSKLLTALTKHADRWDSFCVHVEGADSLRDTWPIIELVDSHVSRVQTPRLKHLQIQCGGYHEAVSGCKQLILGPGIPHLSRLHLRSVAIEVNKSILANLTTLDVGCLPPDVRFLHPDFVEILACASSLASLSLTGPCLQGGFLDYLPVRMPSLRSLTFNECSSGIDEDGFMFELHCVISAPNLSSLTLCSLNYLVLCDFLRSFNGDAASAPLKYPALTHLALRNVETFDYSGDIGPTNFGNLGLTISRRFASIEHLELENKSCFLLSQLVALHHNPQSGLPFPHLRKLSWLPYRIGDDKYIKQFISDRTSAGSPISTLQLQGSDLTRINESDLVWFKQQLEVQLVDLSPDLHEWPGQGPWTNPCSCKSKSKRMSMQEFSSHT